MKYAVSIFLVIAATVLVAVGTMRAGLWAPDYNDVKMAYTNDVSRFIELDGMPVHTRDEGSGPVLVLVHGNTGSLHQWDGWAERLKSDFRIIRFDLSPFGLTGPDPNAEFTLKRNLRLLEALVDHFQLETFNLGGTSIGASLALAYTDKHPERVDKLLLSTIPAIIPYEREVAFRHQAIMWFHQAVIKSYTSKIYWRANLESIFGNPNKVTPELVERYHDLNNWPGQVERSNAFIFALVTQPGFDLPQIIERVRTPTLIQWPGKSPVLPGYLIKDVAPLFVNAPTTVIEYPDAGHKLMIEIPNETAEDARAFLNGL